MQQSLGDNSPNPSGSLLVLTGPSGVGKGSLRVFLSKQMPWLKESVSATTRAQRPGEEDGVDYFFVSRTDFEQMIADNALIEWAEFAGNYYGTPKAFFENTLAQGNSILLEIEVQGALNIKRLFPQAHLIFIEPPSLEALEARLRNRNTNDEADIQRRLETARSELAQKSQFDYVVMNDVLENCQEELTALITQLCLGPVPS